MLTYEEILQKCDQDLLNSRDLGSIAATVSINRTELKEYWLTDRGLVSDLVQVTNSLSISDSILAKLDSLATNSPSIAAIVNRLKNDSKGINFGDIALRDQISYLTPSIFTEQERDLLLDLAIKPAPVSVYEVQVVMEGH